MQCAQCKEGTIQKGERGGLVCSNLQCTWEMTAEELRRWNYSSPEETQALAWPVRSP